MMKLNIKFFLRILQKTYHKSFTTVVIVSLMSSAIQNTVLSNQKKQLTLIDQVQIFKVKAGTVYNNVDKTLSEVNEDLEYRQDICLSKKSNAKKDDLLFILKGKLNTDVKNSIHENASSNEYFGEDMHYKILNLLDYVDDHGDEFQSCSKQANKDLLDKRWSKQKIHILRTLKMSLNKINFINSTNDYTQFTNILNDYNKKYIATIYKERH